jgi:hypothetical protein
VHSTSSTRPEGGRAAGRLLDQVKAALVGVFAIPTGWRGSPFRQDGALEQGPLAARLAFDESWDKEG